MIVLEIILNLVHSISASIWLGGCFIMVAITTSEGFFLNKDNEAAYLIISKIFKELVNASMILIFTSGIIMTIQKLSDAQASLDYAIVLIIKIIISIWVAYRIWKFRKTGYKKYSTKFKEWVFGYNSFIFYGVLIFFLAEILGT
tara:strand:+ start:893 stop:1324 length:432 start_codon:yes stop_codon:yes gene_type:complete